MGPQRFSDGSFSSFTLHLHPPRSRPLRKSPEPFGPAATLIGPKTFGLPACRSRPTRAAWGCGKQESRWAADICGVRPTGGRGEMGLDPAEPGLRPARGNLPPEQSEGGGWPSCGRDKPLGAEVQGSARPTYGIVPPGKIHSPSPPGLGYGDARSERPKVLFPTKDAVPSRSSFRPG